MTGNGNLTPEDWDRHRDIITELWRFKTLKALRDHMQANYDFSASGRMYEERFRKWGLHKYSKKTKKDVIDPQTQFSPDLKITEDYGGRDSRHLQDMHRKNAVDLQALCSRVTGSEDSATSPSPSPILTPQSIECDSPNDKEHSAVATSKLQTLHASVVRGRSYTPYHPVYRMPDHVTSDSQNLETILRSIHSCFVRPNIDHHNHFPAPNQVSLRNSGPQALFWGTLKQAIYLYKIPGSERAIPVFDKAGMLASNAFVDSSMTFVLELLSTFSPVNTAVCPDLRLALLRVFVHHAVQRFGSTHSVTVLCSETQKDRSAVEISERGLSLMIDLLTATRGTSDPLTLKAQLARIRLLRRGKDHDRAGAMARALASSSIGLFGIQSVAARLASRELEHILMDQNEWYQALEVCLSIVGQRSCAGEMLEPESLDGYAVYTMEDIAKIYDQLGQPGPCVEWLSRAARSASFVWGPSVATTHVVDKLVAALDEAGKHDDAMFWRGVLVSGGDGIA